MTKVAVVYHSGAGHTQKLAEAVHAGAKGAGVEAVLFRAEDFSSREEGPWAELDSADAIIFGAPTYMGSISAQFKGFMDATSGAWFAQRWKDKLAAGFTNSSSPSGDKQNSLVQLATLAAQHGMIWVSAGMMPGFGTSDANYETAVNRLGFFLGVGTQSFSDLGAEQAPGEGELETGRNLGARVAEAAKRWG